MAADLVDRPQLRLEYPEDCLDYRGLSRPSPPHNAHLFLWLDLDVEVPQDQGQVVVVPARKRLHLKGRNFRPFLMKVLTFFGCLNFLFQPNRVIIIVSQILFRVKLPELQYSLGTDHQTLDQNNLSQKPFQKLTNGDEVDSSDSIQTSIFRTDLADSQIKARNHE